MKANIQTAKKGKGPYHGHELRLTIGMIVKNEEKTLDKCLSSLKPLLDAVPSELIITDTGSTDRTLEIAEKYTNQILHFDWCGDFSAARNTGLKEAKGEWFMFIDGDEWFEDVSEIIDFFNSRKCNHYWSASYRQKNYMDSKSEAHSYFDVCRLHRFFPGLQFKNKVHEDMIRKEPTYMMKSFVHHYGYVVDDIEAKKEKNKRNLTLLLEELEENPVDMKAYQQIVVQYMVVNDYDKAISYAKKGLEVERSNPIFVRKIGLIHSLLKSFMGKKQYEEVLQVYEDYIKNKIEENIVFLDYYNNALVAALYQKQYELALDFATRYLILYQKYKDHRLDETLMLYCGVDTLNKISLQRVQYNLGFCYSELNKKEELIKMLEEVNSSDEEIEEIHQFFGLYLSAAQKFYRYDLLSGFYKKMVCNSDDKSRMTLIQLIEVFGMQKPKQRVLIEDQLVLLPIQDEYVQLNKLRQAERLEDHSMAISLLEWFTLQNICFTDYLSDVFYYTMKEKINILLLLLKTDLDDLSHIALKIQQTHVDFIDTVKEYFNTYSFENGKGLYWSVTLREKCLLKQNEDLSDKELTEIFNDYVISLTVYLRFLYRTEMFTQANLPVLPRYARFGYYMGLALDAEKKADDKEYLENLRLALDAYPIMERPIKLLLQRFEKEQEIQQSRADEFEALTAQVKQKIEKLIQQDKLKEAGQVTAQLAALLPEDQDIVRYRKLTNTEPSMVELVSQLPQ